MVVFFEVTAIRERVSVTIIPTRFVSYHLTLGLRQFSFHHTEIALRNTPV